MNDPKHSAGPWKIDGQFDDDVAVSIQAPSGFDICEIYPLMGKWSPEDIANARLMENAPSLLRMLKAVLLNDSFSDTTRAEALATIAAAEATQ
ncbi:MAG TPA: hypothetical protein VHC90_09720 [Bryobacteraceae bacterium]|nr:hypothetical protein [Bryobacteraceae bacterium]